MGSNKRKVKMENWKTEITLLWQKRLNWNYHEEVLSLVPLTCHCFIFSGKLNMKPLLGDKMHCLPADILPLCQGGKTLQILALRPGFPVKISLETSELFSAKGPATMFCCLRALFCIENIRKQCWGLGGGKPFLVHSLLHQQGFLLILFLI